MGNSMTPAKPECRLSFSREWVVLAITMICILFYRLYFIRFYDVMSADGTGYAASGKSFFQTWDPHAFGTLQPPLYPFFVGVFNLVLHDLKTAARSVSVVFSTLTLVPL